METGDGFVLRVKPRGGILDLAVAGAVARLALEFGNGELDLTARSNLQIRGARAATLEPLTRGLANLGLLDPDPESEAIRNVVASPLAALDSSAHRDIRPLVVALEDKLGADEDLRGLPAKWSFLVDDGGLLNLSGIPADVRFEADPAGTLRVGLADRPERALCIPGELPDVAVALGRLALEPEPRRMAALLEERDVSDIFTMIGLSLAPELGSRHPTRPEAIVGPHRLGEHTHVGVGTAFGCLNARDLLTLVDTAQACGAFDLRLTPWRVIILTCLSSEQALRLQGALVGMPFILDPGDPRLAIAACSGAPACHRGTTPVRDHARALARLAERFSQIDGIEIHVSGCAKGCAHGQPAPWTLVGRDGAYDLVRNGKAGDPPLLRGLSFQDAAGWLSRAGEGRW